MNGNRAYDDADDLQIWQTLRLVLGDDSINKKH